MANLAPMLGAVFAHVKTPADKKLRPKPKTHFKRGHKVTHGEKSVTQKHQQHGELATAAAPKPLTDRQMVRDSARSSMRRATDDWVNGRISTKEHNDTHGRARHVLSGKRPGHR